MENPAPDVINRFVTELNKNLKEVTDMVQILGQDCAEQYLTIQNNNSQTSRRAYVRSVFAFIEGILHRMNLTAAHLGTSLGTLSIAEIVMIDEMAFDVNDKGEVVSKSVFIKFLNKVKFAFRVYSKSSGSSFELSFGGNGWQKLRECVKVRDRLMHPKATTDLKVADPEVEAAKLVFNWFLTSYRLCSHYAEKASQAKTSATPEDIAALDAEILDLETKLVQIGS
jgi:hypothetical protein